MNEPEAITRPVSGYPEVIDYVVELAAPWRAVKSVQRTSPNSAVIVYAPGADWRVLEVVLATAASARFSKEFPAHFGDDV